jgi:hypothetical protein
MLYKKKFPGGSGKLIQKHRQKTAQRFLGLPVYTHRVTNSDEINITGVSEGM